MSTWHGDQVIRSSAAAVAQWCRDWIARGSGGELRAFDEAEIGEMARDAGLSAGEFRELARLGPQSAELLSRRLAALDLDEKEVGLAEPQTLHDLQRVCTLCQSHGRCRYDLARDAGDPVWKSYCPNAATLEALDAEPWAARGEW